MPTNKIGDVMLSSTPNLRHLDNVLRHIGRERLVTEVSRELYQAAFDFHAPVVGALHIHCADEAEYESVNAFRQLFIHRLLPKLKTGQRGTLLLANLGARYEWGALHVADEHFSTPEAQKQYKLLVVKINTHVGVTQSRTHELLGEIEHYGRSSPCCGALTALLAGGTRPFLQELREMFQSENNDRLDKLMDDTCVAPDMRSLMTAVVAARLQARRAMLDIQALQAMSPTVFWVVPCVSLNRPGQDTEIVCGLYTSDRRGETPQDVYVGLGDDPGTYQVSKEFNRYYVDDLEGSDWRPARDHREWVWNRWQARSSTPSPQDARLASMGAEVAANKHLNTTHAKALLKLAMPILAEVAPIPAALFLFAQGLVGIHHIYRVHRLADEAASSAEARPILDEVQAKIDTLDPDKAQGLVELLAREYGS